MADSLTEEEITILHQAIAYRRASKVAAAVFTLENVMGCIKALLLERSSALVVAAVKVEQDATSPADPSMDTDDTFVSIPNLIDLPLAKENPEQTTHSGATDEGVVFQPRNTGERSLAYKLAELASKPVENITVQNVMKDESKKRKTQPRQADLKSSLAMFTCEKCGYQTGRKDHFKRHSNSHLDVKPYSCRLCSFTCSDNYHLIRHLKSSVHNNTKRRSGVMQCDVCDYKTNQSNRMERHKRTHSGEKPFACEHCPYKAAQRATLDRHILTHTGEKPFKCKNCEYCAADTKSLKFHTLQKHGGEGGTLHQCNECDYSTPVLRYFTLHLRAHSDVRPYLCDICGYSAKRPHGLSKHYRSMHGWSKTDTDGKQWKKMTLSVSESEEFSRTVTRLEEEGPAGGYNPSVFNPPPPIIGDRSHHTLESVSGPADASRRVSLQQTVKTSIIDFNPALYNPADFPHTNINRGSGGGDAHQTLKYSLDTTANFSSIVFNPSGGHAEVSAYQSTSYAGGGNSERALESLASGEELQSEPPGRGDGDLLHTENAQTHYELFL